LEFAYNNNVHASTGCIPLQLLYGFLPKSPLDFLTEEIAQDVGPYGMSKQSSSYLEKLRVLRENTHLGIACAQEEQTKYHNRGRREVPEFKVGSRVLISPHSLEWIESKGEGAKLVQRWIGPFEVLQKLNPKTYCVRLDNKYPGFPVFNIEHLKPYKESPEDLGPRSAMPGTRDHKVATEEYEVDKIIGYRYDKRKKTKSWLVRWKGYNAQHDTWQTQRDLRNTPEMIQEYSKSLRSRD
jgi:hypothetical protein